MNLSEKQKKIVESNKSKVIVASCAGSGKTTCLISRYRYLAEQGVNPTKIVMITFTNAAAEEISERLGQPKGVFIGTIHSYANYLLLSRGEETKDLLENEAFDKLFERIKAKPECVKPIEHLLLDEGQDSTATQFEFLFDILKPKNWMVFADWRQSVYRWNGAYPDYILGLSRQTDVTTYPLDENYRNADSILNFAKNIILTAGRDYQDTSIPMRGVTGRVSPDIEYNPYAIARTFAGMNGGYGSWFILTRTNAQIDELANIFERMKIPYDTFKRAQLDNKELNKKMKEDTVKILTIHTAKGLEADNVIVVGAKFYNTEEKCVSYVAATRARNRLIWTRAPYNRKSNYRTNNWET